MASQFEPWFTRNLQTTKSVFNHNLQTCKSSQVIGRKINNACLTVKSQKIKKFRPNIILLPVNLKKTSDTSKVITAKRSPCRSLSLNKIITEKELKLDIPYYVSPPRQVRSTREKRKHISQIIENEGKIDKHKPSNIKNILTESIYKVQQEKQQILKKEIEEKIKQESKKEKLKATNEKIRKKNAKIKKIIEFKHPKPWGSDQRLFKDSSDIKSSDNEELRSKIRAEREIMKKTGRKAIGLDLYPNAKIKLKKSNKSNEKIIVKKNPDPSIAVYMKQKNKSRRVTMLQRKLEETLKERERILALERLEKTQRKKYIKKHKTKSKAKSLWIIENEKSTEITQPVYKKHEFHTLDTEGSNVKENTLEPKECLARQLRDLQKRVSETQDLLKTQAAIILQKWFRENRRKFNSQKLQSLTDSLQSSNENVKNPDPWFDIIDTPKQISNDKSILIKEFTEKLNERHAEIEKRVLLNDKSKSSDLAESSKAYKLDNEQETEQNLEVNDMDEDSLNDSKDYSDVFIEQVPFSIQNKPKITHKLPPLSLNLINSSINQSNSSSKADKTSSNHSKDPKSLEIFQEENKSKEILSKTSLSGEDNLENSFESYEDVKENHEHDESIKTIKSNSHHSEESLDTFKYYPQNEGESPKDSLDYESYDSKEEYSQEEHIQDEHIQDENIDSQSPESDIRDILSKKDHETNEIGLNIDRPGIQLINESDSSEEEWNRNVVLIQDSTVAEQQLENKLHIIQGSDINVRKNSDPLLIINDFDKDIDNIVYKEVNKFVDCITFILDEKDINPTIEFISQYLQAFYEEMRLKEEEMLDIINTPAYQDPLLKLTNLKQAEIGNLSKHLVLELILPPDFCKNLNNNYKITEKPSRQIYLQMIFDCINEALNYIRPFGIEGLPDPWSSTAATIFGEGQISNIFERIKKFIEKWAQVKAGSYPDESIRNDDEKLQKLREERLSVLLTQNIADDEKKWLGYTDEETQIKIISTELILDDLIYETLQILDEDFFSNSSFLGSL